MLAGSVSAAAVNPADVVKTRLQLLNKGANDETYKSIPDAFRLVFNSVQIMFINCRISTF